MRRGSEAKPERAEAKPERAADRWPNHEALGSAENPAA